MNSNVIQTKVFGEVQTAVRRFMDGDGQFILLQGGLGCGKTTLLETVSETMSTGGVGVIKSSAMTDDPEYGILKRGFKEKNLEHYIEENPPKIHLAMLTGDDGNIICSVKAEETEVDADILGGMTTAVESFVKDSFGQATGKDFVALDVGRSFNTYAYRDQTLLMLRFKYGNLTILLEGELSDSLKTDLNRLADKIETEYGPRIESWHGELNSFEDLEGEILVGVIERYSGLLPDVAPKIKNLRIQNRLLEKIEKSVRGSKLAFLLDDIHLADSVSIEALDFLARNLSRNVLIVASSEASAAELGLKSFAVLDVVGFDEEEAKQFLKGLMVPDIPPDVMEAFWSEGGGNPFVMGENVRLLREKLSDPVEWKKELVEKGTPLMTPDDVIIHKLKMLGPEAYETLEWAAIIGQEFDETFLSRMPRLSERSVQICEKGAPNILIPNNGKWRFSESRVRQVLLNNMGADDRKKKFTIVAEELESELGVYQIARIRYEAVKAGSEGWRRAIEAIEDYAEELRMSGRNEESFKQYERALEITRNRVSQRDEKDMHTILGWLLTEIADLEFDVGRFDSCIETNKERIKVAKELGNAILNVDALNQIAYCKVKTRAEGILDCTRESLEIAENTGYKKGVFDAKYRIAAFHYISGEYEKSNELLIEALKIAKELGNIPMEHQTLGALALNYSYLGEYDPAFEYYEMALELLGGREMFERAKVFNNMGLAYKNKGVEGKDDECLEESILFYGRSRDIYLELGYLYGAALACINLTEPNRLLKRYDAALEAGKQAEELANRIGNDFLLSYIYEEKFLAYLAKSEQELKRAYAKCSDLKNLNRLKIFFSETKVEIGKLNETYSQMK